jgi:O-antigen/teichoic acid export membrane protein
VARRHGRELPRLDQPAVQPCHELTANPQVDPSTTGVRPRAPQGRLRQIWASFPGDLIVRRAVRNSGWLLASRGITGLLALVQGALVARALGTGQYGVYAIVTTFVLVLNGLTSFRMNEFVVKYVGDALAIRNREAAAAAIKFAMLLEASASVLAFLVIVALAPQAASWLVHDDGSARLFQVYGLSTLAMLVMESSVGVLHVFNRFGLQALVSVLGALTLLGATATALLLDGRLEAVIWAAAAGASVTSIALSWAAVRTVRDRCGAGWWRIPLGRLTGGRRAAFRFGFSTSASATLAMVIRDADVLWLGYLRGPSEAGLYRLAFLLATNLMLPVAHLGQGFYPEIAGQAARQAWDRMRRLLQQGSKMAAAYLVPICVLLGFTGGPLIRAVFGPEFAPAAGALTILLAGMGFANVLFWARPALLALGRADYPFKVSSGLAVLKLVGVFTLVPAYGYVGNAALLSAIYVLGVGLAALKVWSIVGRRTVTG